MSFGLAYFEEASFTLSIFMPRLLCEVFAIMGFLNSQYKFLTTGVALGYKNNFWGFNLHLTIETVKVKKSICHES